MRKGEATRERILDDAMQQASVVGLNAISIGELAASSGLSKSGLFAHFGSKEQLQLAVVEAAVGRFIDSVVKPALEKPRGLPRLRALVENWIAWGRSSVLPGGCILVAASSEMDDQPGPVRDALAESQRQWLATIAKAVELAVDSGHLHPDTEPKQVAFELYGFLLAFHHAHRLLKDKAANRRIRSAVDRLLESYSVTSAS